ncbi:MAG: hypothetical protein AAGF24_15800, partial [Cyanobacteria bacterium P01_H01_bin.121]
LSVPLWLCLLPLLFGCQRDRDPSVQVIKLDQPSLQESLRDARQPSSPSALPAARPSTNRQAEAQVENVSDRLIQYAGWQLQPTEIWEAGDRYIDAFELEREAEGRWFAVAIEAMNITTQDLIYDDLPLYSFALITAAGEVVRDYKFDDRDALVPEVFPQEAREVILLFDLDLVDTPTQLTYTVIGAQQQQRIYRINLAPIALQ